VGVFPRVALVQIGSPAVPELIKALKDKDPGFSSNAVGMLVQIGSPAVAALVEALKDDDPILRRNAASALGQIGPKAEAAVTALADALKDKEADVRTSAASALRGIGLKPETAVPALIEALKDENWGVRQIAVWALMHFIEEKEAPVLREMDTALADALKDNENREVRGFAATALVQIGPKARAAAMPGLVEALKDREAPGLRET